MENHGGLTERSVGFAESLLIWWDMLMRHFKCKFDGKRAISYQSAARLPNQRRYTSVLQKGDNAPLSDPFSFDFKHVLTTLFTKLYNVACALMENLWPETNLLGEKRKTDCDPYCSCRNSLNKLNLNTVGGAQYGFQAQGPGTWVQIEFHLSITI